MAASFSSPFEPLRLSPQEGDQLEELARVLIAQVADQFEAHLEDPTRSVDASRWKLVKEREDVHVYKERPPDRRQRRARRDTAMGQRFSTDSMDAGSVYGGDLDYEPPAGDASDLPILLTVGTIQGDLYDTMYGVTNPTTEMMRIKTAYIQDGMIDSAVLARLREPTPEDPFRSLTVKWCIKGQALHLRTLVSNRDLVYLEATGLMRLPRSGELVGYQLLHSVDFPQTHRIQGCLRGNMSIVGLYRQHREGVVEMYGKGFVDPTGRIVRALVVKSAAEAMLSTWRTIQTAQLKKLAHALRTRHLDRHGVIRRRRKSSSLASVDSKSCSICSKTLSSMAALSFGKKGFASRCQLCLNVVCTSCRVKKQLASVAPDGWLDVQQVPFCVACIDAVTKTSAFDIALDELVHKDAHAGHGVVSLSSTLSSFETRSESEWSETARKASYA